MSSSRRERAISGAIAGGVIALALAVLLYVRSRGPDRARDAPSSRTESVRADTDSSAPAVPELIRTGTVREHREPRISTARSRAGESAPSASELSSGAPPFRVEIVARGAGTPIGGESVSFRIEGSDGVRRLRETTDEDGRVEIAGLVPGIHALSVAGESFVTAHRAIRIAAAGGDAVTIAVERGYALRGRVVDRHGQPLAGALVVAYTEPSNRHRAMSGVDGSFDFGGLRPGTWQVSATRHDRIGPAPIPVAVPSDRPLEVSLRPSEDVFLRVESADGQPVPGAVVNARFAGFAAGAFPIRPATTGSDGRAHFGGLLGESESSLDLDVSHPDHPPVSRRIQLGELESGTVVVRFDPPGALRIEVVDAGGAPVRDALVRIRGSIDRTLRTTSAGAALFRELPGGTYEIQASTADRGASAPLTVAVEPGQESAARLGLAADRGEIGGVVERADGSPAALVPIELFREDGSWRTTSDAEGRFRFAGLPARGAFRLRAADEHGVADLVDVRAGAADVAVTLRATGALEGVIEISDARGESESAELALALEPIEPESRAPPRTYRFSSGSPWFRLEQVPEGRYRLQVLRGGEPAGTPREVTVGANETPEPLWIDAGAR